MTSAPTAAPPARAAGSLCAVGNLAAGAVGRLHRQCDRRRDRHCRSRNTASVSGFEFESTDDSTTAPRSRRRSPRPLISKLTKTADRNAVDAGGVITYTLAVAQLRPGRRPRREHQRPDCPAGTVFLDADSGCTASAGHAHCHLRPRRPAAGRRRRASLPRAREPEPGRARVASSTRPRSRATRPRAIPANNTRLGDSRGPRRRPERSPSRAGSPTSTRAAASPTR